MLSTEEQAVSMSFNQLSILEISRKLKKGISKSDNASGKNNWEGVSKIRPSSWDKRYARVLHVIMSYGQSWYLRLPYFTIQYVFSLSLGSTLVNCGSLSDGFFRIFTLKMYKISHC